MKKIFVIRSAPYDYLIKGKTLYESFDLVAQGKFSPKINNEIGRKLLGLIFKQENKNDIFVICSRRKRSIETAQIITKKIRATNLLIEVDYKMGEFISETSFYGTHDKPDVDKARRSFVNALIHDKLQEKYNSVMSRIEKIVKVVSSADEKYIVLISHGFFMKIIEAYIRDPKIKNNPKKLLKYFSGRHETFHFCEGFVVGEQKGDFKFKKYIRNNG